MIGKLWEQLVVVDGKVALFCRGTLLFVEAVLDSCEDLYSKTLSPLLVDGVLAPAPRGEAAERHPFAPGDLVNGYVVTGARS